MTRQHLSSTGLPQSSSWLAGMVAFILFAGIAGAAPLVNGGVVTGTIAFEAQLDTYTFSAAPGEHITLRIADTSGTQFSPKVQLLDPFNILVGEEQGGSVATVEHAVTQLGVFTVRVFDGASSGFDAGDYALWFAQIPGAASPGPILNDSVNAESITLGDLDTYTFPVSSGEHVTLRIADIDLTNLTPRLEVYDPTGAQILWDRGGRVATVEFTAETSGTFSLLVRDDRIGTNGHDIGTGPYELRLARIPGANELGTLVPDIPISDQIDMGDLDTFVFGSPAGANVTIQVTDTSGTFKPRVELYGPDGSRLAATSNGAIAGVGVQTMVAGVYTVLVRDDSVNTGNDADAGTYDILMTTDVPAAAVPLAPWVAWVLGASLLLTSVCVQRVSYR